MLTEKEKEKSEYPEKGLGTSSPQEEVHLDSYLLLTCRLSIQNSDSPPHLNLTVQYVVLISANPLYQS